MYISVYLFLSSTYSDFARKVTGRGVISVQLFSFRNRWLTASFKLIVAYVKYRKSQMLRNQNNLIQKQR